MIRLAYVGPWTLHTGYGQAARDHLRALRRHCPDIEIRLSSVHQSDLWPEGFSPQDVGIDSPSWPTHVLIHATPANAGLCLERYVYPFPDGVRRILLTTWEGSLVPLGYLGSLNAFDQVWVSSQAQAARFKSVCQAKVVLHPHDPDFWKGRPARDSRRPYRFYTVGTWDYRKNTASVVEAFLAEFTSQDEVELSLVVSGHSIEQLVAWTADIRAATHLPQETLPTVRVIPPTWNRTELRQIHWDHDCFVTLSRAEAFMVSVYEAACAGNWIIGTSYVLDHWTGVEKVPCQMRPAFMQKTWADAGWDCHQLWAEPNMVAAMGAIRKAANERPTPNYQLDALHTDAKVAKRMRGLLEEA